MWAPCRFSHSAASWVRPKSIIQHVAQPVYFTENILKSDRHAFCQGPLPFSIWFFSLFCLSLLSVCARALVCVSVHEFSLQVCFRVRFPPCVPALLDDAHGNCCQLAHLCEIDCYLFLLEDEESSQLMLRCWTCCDSFGFCADIFISELPWRRIL